MEEEANEIVSIEKLRLHKYGTENDLSISLNVQNKGVCCICIKLIWSILYVLLLSFQSFRLLYFTEIERKVLQEHTQTITEFKHNRFFYIIHNYIMNQIIIT